MAKKKIKTIIICLLISLTIIIICSFVVPVKTEYKYFEDVLFEWDDDLDAYDISIVETNEKGLLTSKHYYIKTKAATLVYSNDEWTCYGEIMTYYDIYGREHTKIITNFHINVYEELKNGN